MKAKDVYIIKADLDSVSNIIHEEMRLDFYEPSCTIAFHVILYYAPRLCKSLHPPITHLISDEECLAVAEALRTVLLSLSDGISPKYEPDAPEKNIFTGFYFNQTQSYYQRNHDDIEKAFGDETERIHKIITKAIQDILSIKFYSIAFSSHWVSFLYASLLNFIAQFYLDLKRYDAI